MDLRFSVFQRVQIVVVILNDLSLSLSLSHTRAFHIRFTCKVTSLVA